MSLGTETLKVTTFNRHLLLRETKAKSHRRNMILSLSLTSMVDMFSLLVIFLLQSFSASPELFTVKGLSLPIASSGQEVREAPVITLTKEGVFLDQKFLGISAKVLTEPEALLAGLRTLRKRWIDAHPGEAFAGEIHLQADKEIPSSLVSELMGILPAEHFGVIQLAVLSGSQG